MSSVYRKISDNNSNNNDNDDDNKDHPYDLYRKENFALAMSYFSVGITMSLISTPLNIYLVETLNAEPIMQSTIYTLQSLPWALKLLFGNNINILLVVLLLILLLLLGFVSDAVPIYGMHRKPYLTMGTLLYSLAFILYSFSDHDSVVKLAMCIFFGTMGLIQLGFIHHLYHN